MFFFDINLFKMIIYKVPNWSPKFCHSMKMKTTRIWVDLTTDAQKIKVAVYCFAFGWKKRFNGFSTKCYKVKKPSRRSGVVVSFLSNKVSGDEAFVCKDTCNLAKNVFQSFFLVKNDQTKNTWKLKKQRQLFWAIPCFKFVFW